MRRSAAIALALLLAIAGITPAIASATAVDGPSPTVGASRSADIVGPVDAPATPADLGDGFAQTGDIAADTVILRAELEPDGDAHWRIAYRIKLSDENTTAAFESLQADIRANTSAYVERFASRMRATVAVAENATGREMSVSNVSVAVTRTPFPTSTDYGVVAYSFDWEHFAETRGRRVVAGDALAGLYLDSGTVLTFAWPEEYDARTVSPAADRRSETAVTWRGERNFGPDQPSVIVAPASALPVRPVYLAGAAVLLLGIAGAALLRRRGDLPIETGDGGASNASDDAATAPTDSAASATTEPNAEAGAGASTVDAGGAESTDGSDATDADTAPPEELLSPHERVVRLVEDNGGRMKQADVTAALDWSAARTSQVVGDLRDDGDIESFRLGRENVLRLPEADDEPHPGDIDRGDGSEG